jgi:hypothetical protein
MTQKTTESGAVKGAAKEVQVEKVGGMTKCVVANSTFSHASGSTTIFSLSRFYCSMSLI